MSGIPRRDAAPGLVALSAVTLAVLAAALAGAIRLDPPPGPGAEPAGPEVPAAPRPAPATPETDVLAAVARDPFRPERSPAPAAPAEAPATARPIPSLRVVGTAVYPDGSGLVALAVPGRPPRLVRVGQEYQGLRVVRVTAGTVTLEGPGDTTIQLTLGRPAGTGGR